MHILDGSTIVFDSCNFDNNAITSVQEPGNLFNVEGSASVTFFNCSFTGNRGVCVHACVCMCVCHNTYYTYNNAHITM